eukprot:gene19668-26354_t
MASLGSNGATNVNKDLTVGGDIILKGKLYKERELVEVTEKGTPSNNECDQHCKCVPLVGMVHQVETDEGYFWLTGDDNHVVGSMTRGQFALYATHNDAISLQPIVGPKYHELKPLPSFMERHSVVTIDSMFVLAKQCYPEHIKQIGAAFGSLDQRDISVELMVEIVKIAPEAFAFSMNTFLELYYPFMPKGLAAEILKHVGADVPALRCAAYLDTLADGAREAFKSMHASSSIARRDVLAKLVRALRRNGTRLDVIARVMLVVNTSMVFVHGDVEASLACHEELYRFIKGIGGTRLSDPMSIDLICKEIVATVPGNAATELVHKTRQVSEAAREDMLNAIVAIPDITPDVVATVRAFDFTAPVVDEAAFDELMPTIADPFVQRAVKSMMNTKVVATSPDRVNEIFRTIADIVKARSTVLDASALVDKLGEFVKSKAVIAGVLLIAAYTLLSQRKDSPLVDLIRANVAPVALNSVMQVANSKSTIFDMLDENDAMVNAAISDVIYYEALQAKFATVTKDVLGKYAVFTDVKQAFPVFMFPFESLLLADHIVDAKNVSMLPSTVDTKNYVKFMEFANATTSTLGIGFWINPVLEYLVAVHVEFGDLVPIDLPHVALVFVDILRDSIALVVTSGTRRTANRVLLEVHPASHDQVADDRKVLTYCDVLLKLCVCSDLRCGIPACTQKHRSHL